MAGTYDGMNAAQRLERYHQLLALTPEPDRGHYRSTTAWLAACAHRENVIQRYSAEYSAAVGVGVDHGHGEGER